MHKILVADKIAEAGLERLRAAKEIQFDVRHGLSPDELAKIAGDYDGMLIRSAVKVTAPVLARPGRLSVIAVQGGAQATFNVAKLMMGRKTITGSTLRPQSIEAKAAMASALKEKIWPLLEAGTVKPVLFKTFPLHQAEAALASINEPGEAPPDVKPFRLHDFTGARPSAERTTLELIRDVELDLKIELGRTHLPLDEVLRLRKGSVVPLEKLAGDPVDIFVNGRLIARGEVLVLNDNFCVRVAELIAGEAA